MGTEIQKANPFGQSHELVKHGTEMRSQRGFAQGLSGVHPLHSSAYSPVEPRQASHLGHSFSASWTLSLWFSLLGEKLPSCTALPRNQMKSNPLSLAQTVLNYQEQAGQWDKHVP